MDSDGQAMVHRLTTTTNTDHRH